MNNTYTMKFDVIVGNPPYNAPKEKKDGSEKLGGGSTMWDGFVEESFNNLKEFGYLCLVHPIGWRAPVGRYSKVSEIYRKNNLIYVRMNNSIAGLKTFGAETAFDVVICQKTSYQKTTKLVGYDDVEVNEDISNWPCIPSGKFNDVLRLIAISGCDRCVVGYSRSDYGSDKQNISNKKTDKYQYPVVHSVNKKNEPTFLYSSENKGMFGVTKVIFGRRKCGTLLDLDGIYACSQDTRYVGCTREDSDEVLAVMRSEKFLKLMKYLSWNSTAADYYDKNGISLLRKDFYKSFI